MKKSKPDIQKYDAAMLHNPCQIGKNALDFLTTQGASDLVALLS